jgi:hypothetical protein
MFSSLPHSSTSRSSWNRHLHQLSRTGWDRARARESVHPDPVNLVPDHRHLPNLDVRHDCLKADTIRARHAAKCLPDEWRHESVCFARNHDGGERRALRRRDAPLHHRLAGGAYRSMAKRALLLFHFPCRTYSRALEIHSMLMAESRSSTRPSSFSVF